MYPEDNCNTEIIEPSAYSQEVKDADYLAPQAEPRTRSSLGLLSTAQQESFPRDSLESNARPKQGQLLGIPSRSACLQSRLLLGLQGCALRMGVCSRYFKELCRNHSSETSQGTIFCAVMRWLEQPSAHLLNKTGLLPPTHTSFQDSGLPLGSIGRFLCFIQCAFHMKYRQRPRDKEQDLRHLPVR